MNSRRNKTMSLSRLWDDCVLAAMALAALGVLLTAIAEPAITRWQNRPRQGMQVSQHFDGQEGAGADAADYLLYLPKEYDAGRKWPLVVFLHGSGERGRDIDAVRRSGPPRLIDQGRNVPFILVSPQCPVISCWTPKNVVKLIEHVTARFAVDADRVYLTGYSMGGFGVWQTACYDPGRFAAIAPLAGGGDPTQAARLVNLPVWAFHGAQDTVVPLDRNKMMIDALKKHGGHAEFTIYPDCGHAICEMVFENERLYEWLLAHNRSTANTRCSAMADSSAMIPMK